MKSTLGTISLVFYVVVAFSIMSSVVFFSTGFQNLLNVELTVNEKGTIILCNQGTAPTNISKCEIDYLHRKECNLDLSPHVSSVLFYDDCFTTTTTRKCAPGEEKIMLAC